MTTARSREFGESNRLVKCLNNTGARVPAYALVDVRQTSTVSGRKVPLVDLPAEGSDTIRVVGQVGTAADGWCATYYGDQLPVRCEGPIVVGDLVGPIDGQFAASTASGNPLFVCLDAATGSGPHVILCQRLDGGGGLKFIHGFLNNADGVMLGDTAEIRVRDRATETAPLTETGDTIAGIFCDAFLSSDPAKKIPFDTDVGVLEIKAANGKKYRQLLHASCTEAVPAMVMRGPFNEGISTGGGYNAGDTVIDEGWLATSKINGNADRARPEAIGGVVRVVGDAPSWTSTSQNQAVMLFGLRVINLTGEGDFLRTAHLWTPAVNAQISQELWIVRQAGTSEQRWVQLLGARAQTVAGWQDIVLPGTSVLLPGETVDVVAVSESLQAAVGFNANWDYVYSNGAPASGQATHRSNGTRIRFHVTDNDGGDRTADLASVATGWTIQAGGFEWTVTAITDNITDVEFDVVPSTRIGEGIYNFAFDTSIPVSIAYDYVPNLFLGRTDLRGWLSTTGYDFGNVVLDDNAYQLDVGLQVADFSDNWDFAAFTEL